MCLALPGNRTPEGARESRARRILWALPRLLALSALLGRLLLTALWQGR